jgi:serine/threonine protein kinase
MLSIVRATPHSKLMAVSVVCAKMLVEAYLVWKGSTVTYKVLYVRNCPSTQVDDRLPVALLRSLITRHPNNRPTPTTLPSHPFFSSLPISTLNFLDRSNFTAKTREEKISFMKGLANVLDNFSEGLRTRKILPSLLEEVSATI